MAITGIICRLCRSRMELEPLVLDVVFNGKVYPVKLEQAHVCHGCPHIVLYSAQVATVNATIARESRSSAPPKREA